MQHHQQSSILEHKVELHNYLSNHYTSQQVFLIQHEFQKARNIHSSLYHHHFLYLMIKYKQITLLDKLSLLDMVSMRNNHQRHKFLEGKV